MSNQSDTSTPLHELYKSVQGRKRPEDVAEIVLRCNIDGLSHGTRCKLRGVAKNSLRTRTQAWTSMLQDYRRPTNMKRSVRVAKDLFTTAPDLPEDQCGDPDAVIAFIEKVSGEIGKTYGESSFKYNRMNREQRQEAGYGSLSRRGYNKRFRLLARMEGKVLKLAREVKKYEFTRIGKSGLATHIPEDQFKSDPRTAAFVAYFTARRNLRSTFTWGKQTRAYDEICEGLFQDLLKHREDTNWWAVAHVYPHAKVLKNLTEDQKGRMLGTWFRTLQDIGELLEDTWSRSNINRETMIVRRGNDSSTWNNTASAWNKARDAWIELLYSMGAEELLDKMCFGKVLRLMAADVAYMHRVWGSGDLEPDTGVWNDLPLPWEVLKGEKTCSKQDVIQACKARGVDPQEKGWIKPRKKTISKFTPTPELVHGVVVSNPDLALALRKGRVFSGKGVRWEALDKDLLLSKSVQDDKVVVTPV